MPTLEDRFRHLDRVEVPHLWPEIESHSEGTPSAVPATGDRLVATVLAIVVSAGGIGVAALAFLGPGPNDAVSVVGRAREVGLECEVRLPSAEVAPGDTVRATFTYRNVGDEALTLGLADAMAPRLQVRAPSGTRLWDTDLGGAEVEGVKSPHRLGPGAWVQAETGFVVLWGGRLTVQPVCDYALVGRAMQVRDHGVIHLSPLQLDVAVPGPTPTASDALELALARTGSLFEACRPGADGAPVVGSIAAPRSPHGREVPALAATCRADVRRGPGFAVVDLVYASPSDLALPPPGGEGSFRGLELPEDADAGQLARWTFLVVDEEARSVSQPVAGDLDPRGGDLLSVVRFPRICPGALDCHVLVLRPRARGGWAASELPSRAGLSAEHGVAFLVPEPEFPPGKPVRLESGSSAGVGWSVFAVPTSDGIALGWSLETGESYRRVVRTVPDPCPVTVLGTGDEEGRDLTAPVDGSDLLFVGPVSAEVSAVEVVLDSGRSGDAVLVPIPDELAPFDAFVAFVEGAFGDRLAGVTALDLRGQVIDGPETCG